MSCVLILAADARAERVCAELRRRGAEGALLEGAGRRALLVTGHADLEGLAGVEAVLEARSAHPLADAAPSQVRVKDAVIGGPEPVLMAGPCAVEDEATLETAAAAVAAAGARVLRGGAFKPRSSPYSFQGAGRRALRWLRSAADRHGLAVVTEALDVRDVDAVAEHADLIQIGSRSMHHAALLVEAGRTGRPILLKRGASATVEEWLLAAEYALEAGAPGVVLCERGVRTYAQPTRNTLDLGAVAWLLEHSRLPVVVDPSHASGRRELIPRLSRAAAALGAHGLLIEVHPDPGRARSDGAQAMTTAAFAELASSLVRVRTGFALS
jgi:3-deoxy-7-phosphoheptulonate synthase